MIRKLILLLSSGVLALLVSSAYADGDEDKKKPEQPQAGAFLIVDNDDPYPKGPTPDTSDYRPVVG